VFFLEPLNPILPDEDHEITCPALLVSEMIMLLNEALMNAIPVGSTLTTRFFELLVDLAIVFLYFNRIFCFLFYINLSVPFFCWQRFSYVLYVYGHCSWYSVRA